MTEHTLIEVKKALVKVWQLERIEEDDDRASREALLQALQIRVRALLERDMNRLMQTLYRLDVPEHETAAAFRQGSIDEIATALSEAILEREIQKMVSRQRHRSSQDAAAGQLPGEDAES